MEPSGKGVGYPKVIIIGGGFAGLQAARSLADREVEVILFDRNNHHTFQPLLYQVATAGLSPSEIAVPIRSILSKHKNIEVVLGHVDRIDPQLNHVECEGEVYPFDYLILAAGATHSYFGRDEWEALAPGLKTLEDATEIRRRILYAFEHAETMRSEEEQSAWLTFVIVGAGPTGVELAGAIAELANRSLVADFRRIDPSKAKIILVEAGQRILSSFPEELSLKAEKSLRKLGVEVRTTTMVTDIGESHVTAGEEKIPTHTAIWAAGVKANPIAKFLNVPLDRAGRVIVNSDLSVPGFPHVFVAGDLAHIETEPGKPVPGVAQGAIQGGKRVASNVLKRIAGQSTDHFKFRDKGNLATIGRSAAIAEIGKLRLSGFIAWLLWLVIHVAFLIGFRTKIMVLIEWGWSYLIFKRGVRLITSPHPHSKLLPREK